MEILVILFIDIHNNVQQIDCRTRQQQRQKSKQQQTIVNATKYAI